MGAIAIVVLILLIFGIGSLLSRCSSNNTAESNQNNAEQTAEQKQESQTPAFNPMPGVEYPDQESLAWRDTDFAVDPEKKTSWNTEKSDEKVMYLTFDDGPSANTQKILDILDKYNCKATFFVIGQEPEYFPMIAEAYHRGHTIGLHSMSHDYEDVYASTDAYFEDLGEIGQVVKDQIGYVPCFTRFPGGSSNTVSQKYSEGIMTQLTEMVPERGYQYYDWNLDSGDGASASYETMLEQTNESDPQYTNYILLCHDAAAKTTTVDALPAIIEHWQALGYTFKAIDRDSWVYHHQVNN